ncbi:MAG: TetR/AcrR family transcriptional regulator [Devosia sp.]|nr:TetR/AcrR family transcriptional regulator [Devosia sp.]
MTSLSPIIADLPVSKAAGTRRTLSRGTWVEAALKVLEKRGIAHVKVDALARQLKVTRGSFYFHFTGIKDLHQSLLDEWRSRNCCPFEALGALPHEDGLGFFEAIVRVWVDEKPFRPLLDLAVRDWSRSVTRLADELAAADAMRIDLLTRAFLVMGYDPDESVVRARITYFHQIGYYALSFKEAPADRRRYQPIYGRVLLGPAAGSRP